MSEKYIRIQDAVDALAKTMPTPATPDGVGDFDHETHIADEAFADAIRIIESIEPADVVSASAYNQVMLEMDTAGWIIAILCMMLIERIRGNKDD